MARHLNQIFVEGNLTKDPEKTKAGQYDLIKFSIGNNFKKGREDHSQFYDCEVWGESMLWLVEAIRKGSHITVVGQHVKESYQGNDGVKKYRDKITVNQVILDSRAGADRQGDSNVDRSGNPCDGDHQDEQYEDDVPF